MDDDSIDDDPTADDLLDSPTGTDIRSAGHRGLTWSDGSIAGTGAAGAEWENLTSTRIQFAQTVEFPDGRTVDDPHQDSLGYVYPTTDDWIEGTNKHVLDE